MPSPTTTTPSFPSTPFTIPTLTLFSVLVRVLVALGPYSGDSNPPSFGDYEAQRHWMEITLHTPVSDWYKNTSANDLAYWGLDYPPLTAYQSLVHGVVFLNASEPESVELGASRGYESAKSKLLMRWTVITSDVIVFFTAAIWFINIYRRRCGSSLEGSAADWQLAMILLNPCLILIDHGHFQYNCISLGLTIAAVAAILSRHEIIGSVLFSLALNHKQMSAYYAPAFLGYLLGKCLQRRHPFLEIFKLGLAVLGTFALVWLPYIHSLDAVLEVLSRLAPFERGIYEDYVANFWCTSSIIIKWKKIFTIKSLRSLSLGATIITFLPSMVHQIKAPSDLGFLYSLLNCSFSFYFFSYQVHEKTILLPLLPASLLVLEEPLAFSWLVYYGLLSMYPLLCRDNLILQYIALLALFMLIYYTADQRTKLKQELSAGSKILMIFTILCSIALHLIYVVFQPPARYPFLFEAFIMLLCFSQFLVVAVYTNRKQWLLGSSPRMFATKKKV